MTGEMSREEVTAEAYPLHFAIAKAFKGTVEPFDQYQGPYVRSPKGKFWIQSHVERCDHGHEHETGLVEVFNETTGGHIACLPEPDDVVSAAKDTL